jgi:hypothetical protein
MRREQYYAFRTKGWKHVSSGRGTAYSLLCVHGTLPSMTIGGKEREYLSRTNSGNRWQVFTYNVRQMSVGQFGESEQMSPIVLVDWP